MDAKPKLASYHQIFLAPSEEEKGSLPTPDDGNLWHMLHLAYSAESAWHKQLSAACAIST